MNKTILVLFLLLPICFWAQNISLEIVQKKETYQPGKIYSLPLKITNHQAVSLSLQQKIVVPTNWQLINFAEEIDLAANESKIILCQLFITNNTSFGNHIIDFQFLSAQFSEEIIFPVTLNVAKVSKISVSSFSKNELIKAGDTISAVFLVANNGNSVENIKLNYPKGTQINQNDSIQLLPGQQKQVVISKITNAKTLYPSSVYLQLEALVKQDSVISARASSKVNIISNLSFKEDIYYRFPIEASTMLLFRNRLGESESAIQYELKGEGNFDPLKRDRYAFRFFGPDRFDFSSFSNYSEYYFNYQSEKFYFHVGDKNFSSSLLTEQARYGTGAELSYKLNKFEVFTFYNVPRFFSSVQNEFMVATKYNFQKDNYIKIGYLLKKENENQDLQFIESQWKLGKSIKLKGEFSLSKAEKDNGYAWVFNAEYVRRKVNANFSYIYASPYFKGYFYATKYYRTNVNYRLSDKFSVILNTLNDYKNIQKDSIVGQAPTRQNVQMGIRYKINNNNLFSVFGGNQKVDDKMEKKLFNYAENFIRLETQIQIKNWRGVLQSYWAKTNNYLIKNEGNSSMYTASLEYSKNNTVVSAFSSYNQSKRYGDDLRSYYLFGGRFQTKIGHELSINAMYQNSHALEDYYLNRNLLDIGIIYQFLPNHQLYLQSRNTLAKEEIQNKDFSVLLKYTVNINVPVKKIKERGTLAGRIMSNYNTEGIKLLLGQQLAIVDKNGNFKFNNLVPGNYFLEIDRLTLDIDDIPTIGMPTSITIEEGENFITFNLVRASAIKGSFLVNNLKDDTFNQKVVVEVRSSSGQIFSKICTINEPFYFTYLMPGNWKVRIYGHDLGSQFKIDNDEFDIALMSNETQEINVHISKKEPKIKLLQPAIKVGY